MPCRALLRCLGAALLLSTSACALSRAGTPDRERQDLVVLLPDPGTGAVGRAAASNPHGTVQLTAAGAAARVSANAAPRATTVDDADIQRLFGALLAGLSQPQRFTLFFRFDSEELTDESRRLVQDVLEIVKMRPQPDVVATGHTDTTGSPASNIDLGLRRATAVRALLVEAGMTPSAIEVRSHGESELLVPTPDGVFERRNRRVDISVR
jgi:outer membrane protein OmpA-like peptidoglycan-associated protein